MAKREVWGTAYLTDEFGTRQFEIQGTASSSLPTISEQDLNLGIPLHNTGSGLPTKSEGETYNIFHSVVNINKSDNSGNGFKKISWNNYKPLLMLALILILFGLIIGYRLRDVGIDFDLNSIKSRIETIHIGPASFNVN